MSFIAGSKNVRSSAFKGHADSDMYKQAMISLRQSQASDVRKYVPIAKALTTINPSAEVRLKRKFDLAYFLAKKNLSFKKFIPLFELEERHGVELGANYKNKKAPATFIDYIARAYHVELKSTLDAVHFFSIHADGSTDRGNIENEVFHTSYFDGHCRDGRIHVRNKLLALQQPQSTTGEGLYECLQRAFDFVEIDNWMKKRISFGCDGASANIAVGGLRGHLEKEVPWVVMFWCLAHRLELALKGALKGNPVLLDVDDMLLRLYYLYEKSPKKCRELKGIVNDMTSIADADDFPCSGGNRPLRVCGTRFISHKLAAMNRVVERYEA